MRYLLYRSSDRAYCPAADIGSDHTDSAHTGWRRMDSVVRSHCTEASVAAHLKGIAPFGIAYSAAVQHPQVAVQVQAHHTRMDRNRPAAGYSSHHIRVD